MDRAGSEGNLTKWLGLLLLMAAWSGCTRAYWRQHADEQTYPLIGEKVTDPRWRLPRKEITPDPMSRIYDPFDPDCEPMPPDDPAANQYQWCVDGIRGSRLWRRLGVTHTVENPQWLQAYGINGEARDPETGNYVVATGDSMKLSLTDAINLSLIHNRDYQSRLEEVYLQALDVSFERFQFDVRYLGFGRREPSMDSAFSFASGQVDSYRILPRAGISQFLPTGGQWIIELANNTLWLFSGDNKTSTASILAYQITQPLLIGAGKRVILNSLTLAERELLYEVRNLARFRQEFFADVVSGDSGGYYSLLVQLQNIRNEQANIRRLERQLESLRNVTTLSRINVRVPLAANAAGVAVPRVLEKQFRVLTDGEPAIEWEGPLSEDQEQRLRLLSNEPNFQAAVQDLIGGVRMQSTTLDILQLQSAIADSVNRVRDLQNTFRNSLDGYKQKLGLPPDFPLELDDAWLRAFQLTDTRLMLLEDEFADLSKARTQAEKSVTSTFPITYLQQRLAELHGELKEIGISSVGADIERVDRLLQERGVERVRREEESIGDFDAARDRKIFLQLKREIEQFEGTFPKIGEEIVLIDQFARAAKGYPLEPGRFLLEQGSKMTRANVLRSLDAAADRLMRLTQQLEVIQIGLRLEMVAAQKFELTIDQAVLTALENRMDLMNARARVMDQRRVVEIIANQLLAQLDVVVNGDIRTPTGRKPFDFRDHLSSLRVGIAFTAPIDQIRERNNYRAVLISYQRARREYMRFEDSVKQQVRASWRQVELTRRNLETWRRAVRIAAAELDAAYFSARLVRTDGVDTGLRGQYLILALNNVLASQNNLINTWINTENARIRIYRDMGLMEIDERGLWVDDFYQRIGTGEDSTPYGLMQGTDGEGGGGMSGPGGPMLPEEPLRMRQY